MKDQERDHLFARARGGASPTDDDRRRVRAALGRKLGIAAGASVGVTDAKAAASVAPAASSTASAAVAGVGFSSLAVGKALAVVVAVAAVGWVAAPVRHNAAPSHEKVLTSAPQTSSPDEPLSKPSVRPLPAIAVPAAPSPEPVARDRAASPVTGSPATASAPIAPSAVVASPSEAAPALAAPAGANPADDLALVKEMQVALRDGDDRRALALVREHERRFPASVLAPERDGVRVVALCSGAGPVEAQNVGQAFLDGHPLSPLAARVRIACQLSR